MDTKIKNDSNLNLDGTGLIGYLEITYQNLVSLFGEPTKGGGYKTDAEWHLKTPNGVISIYNYKDGRNYLGDKGKNAENITDWHVGGSNKEAYDFIVTYIKKSHELVDNIYIKNGVTKN